MYNCNDYDFKNFGTGVYKNTTECEDTAFTHTSVVVGYGTTKYGEDYWEVLNSYGERWGDVGTIRLARNTDWDQYGGQHGILNKPAWNVPKIGITRNGERKYQLLGYNEKLVCLSYIHSDCWK